MCCCGKPTRNDEPGAYSWDGKSRSTYGVEGRAPTLAAGHVLLYDEPGRCGGTDSHSYHFRVVDVRGDGRYFALLVRHGGGEEAIEIGGPRGMVAALALLKDSDARYWLLAWFYHHRSYALRDAEETTRRTWARAAVEKRIKVRKRRGSRYVEIVPAKTPEPCASCTARPANENGPGRLCDSCRES